MTGLSAAEVTLAVAWVSLYAVTGFTTPLLCNNAFGRASHSSFSTRTSAVQQARGSRSLAALQAAAAGEDDGIDEYKRQMEEFMAQAHDKRLEAMEAVKAEVQRGYEEQIAELQAKLSTLPGINGASGDSAVAPVQTAELVGVGASASVGSAAGAIHPAYAARSERPGWEARWGPEEPARSSTVSAADVSAMEARAVGVASAGGDVNTAYAARSERPGWEARWGDEEAARVGGATTPAVQADVHPAYAARSKRPGWEARWGDEEAARIGSATSPAVQADVHPAYAARAQRPGWESRWGDEEASRAAGGVTTSVGAAGDVHPAYAARAQRPGWESRWGDEEATRAAGGVTVTTSVGAAGDVHPAYAARTQRAGWEERWGSEEPARVAGSTSSSEALPAATTTVQQGAATADQHPAYSARHQRPGWESRWGNEEKERVAGGPAGAIAVAGSSAGFAAAGGLDVKAEDVAATPTAPVAAAASGAAAPTASVQFSPDDPLRDNLLPDDVDELKSMVVSFRAHFQDYLIRSLEASNGLKETNIKLNAELSSATAKLASECELRESLQSSFLDYMSRSGDAGATAKTRIAQLEGDVVQLTEKAEELQRFAQEYMVKTSSDKQKALEEAAANARVESAARIAALQAQVLALQAGA